MIAPLLTRGDELLMQTIFYPLMLFSARRDGVALRPSVSGPGYDSPSYGRVDTIDTSAILGEGVLHTFLVNRSQDETAEVEIGFPGGNLTGVQSAEVVTGPNADAKNTFEQPDLIRNRPLEGVTVQNGGAVVQMPPLSLAAITFTAERA